MKKLLITGAAAVSLAAGAYAQGLVDFDNELANNGYSHLTQGNYYTGTATIQVWSLAGSTVDSAINAGNGLAGGNVAGYNQLTTDGFVLAHTYSQITVNDGVFTAANPITLANVTAPNGIIAIALWEGTGSTYGALGSFDGVIAFHESDIVPVASPQSPPNDISEGWNSLGVDLITTQVAIPEPGTLALTGLGAAALLIFRRRK